MTLTPRRDDTSAKEQPIAFLPKKGPPAALFGAVDAVTGAPYDTTPVKRTPHNTCVCVRGCVVSDVLMCVRCVDVCIYIYYIYILYMYYIYIYIFLARAGCAGCRALGLPLYILPTVTSECPFHLPLYLHQCNMQGWASTNVGSDHCSGNEPVCRRDHQVPSPS